MYWEAGRSKHKETWDLIRSLAAFNTSPWCLIGDMDNVLSLNNERWGSPYPNRLFQGKMCWLTATS